MDLKILCCGRRRGMPLPPLLWLELAMVVCAAMAALALRQLIQIQHGLRALSSTNAAAS